MKDVMAITRTVLSRRSTLMGLLAAPAIVRHSSLMPLRGIVMESSLRHEMPVRGIIMSVPQSGSYECYLLPSREMTHEAVELCRKSSNFIGYIESEGC